MRSKKLIIFVLVISFVFISTLSHTQKALAAEPNLYWGSRGTAVDIGVEMQMAYLVPKHIMP